MTATMNTWWLCIGGDELKTEMTQLEEEGRAIPASVKAEYERLMNLGHDLMLAENQAKAGAFFDKTIKLPMRKDYPYSEPSDLATIRKMRPRGPRRYEKKLSDKMLLDRITGAWMGRCIGCLHGRYPMESARSWEIEDFLKMTGQWPLKGYIRYNVKGAAKKKYPKFANNASFDTIDHMPVDDDTNYTTTGYLIVKKYGPDFTPKNVAEFWTQYIPLLATCTAERIAYRNIGMNIAPPDSASYRNPFREWIGAQIRADAFGYVNVGNPERAADFAWRDACISHVKNGIYGEMFVAAMLAAAPYANDLEELIKIGLSEVPKSSRLYEDVMKVVAWKHEGISYEDAVQHIHDVWKETSGHDWCHTITNAVIVTVALLWGEGDFGTSICRAILPGYDTDCNGATVGSVFGMMHGLDSIGEEWKGKLNNTLKTSLVGYETVAVDKIARETYELAKKIR